MIDLSEINVLQNIFWNDAVKFFVLGRFIEGLNILGEKQYSFMSYGPISPLSFSGAPLFFNAYKFPEKFTSSNFLTG